MVVRADAGVERHPRQVPAGAYDIIGRSRRPPAVRTADGSTFEEIITIAFFQTGDFTVGPFQVELLPPREGRGERDRPGSWPSASVRCWARTTRTSSP